METFKYLKKDKCNSLLSKYNVDDLNGKIIIQNNNDMKYHLFNNKEEFKKFIYNLSDEDRTYNEVIFDNIQKFRIDLDYDKVANNNEEILEKNMLEFIEIIIKRTYKLLKNKDDKLKKIKKKYYIFDSSIENKLSYHIVFDFYFNNAMQHRLFGMELYGIIKKIIEKNSELSKTIISTFDTAIYKNGINFFRLPFNQKYGKDNIKKCINQKDLSIFDAMINLYDDKDKILIADNLYKEDDSIKKFINIKEISKDDEVVSNIINIATKNGYLENMELREIISNRLIFNRKKPGFCKLCDRLHDKENNIYIIVNNNQNKTSFKLYCRRNDENFVEYTLDEDYELNNNYYNKLEYFKRLIKNANNNDLEIPEDDIAAIFKNVDKKLIYKESKMREYDFNNKRMLLIKANMKLGKTKALRDYLQKNTKDNQHVIFISFRILFTLDVNKNFADFTNYLSINKNKISIKEYKKIIIQIDSLHKLSLDTIPDLLILDESESILSQFTSPYCRHNLRTIWEIFEFLLKASKKIICMDANLGERTFNVFNKLYPITDMYLHYNTFSTMAQDEYIFILNMNKFLEKLSDNIKMNKRIIIPINSLKKAKLIYKYIKTNFKEKKVCLYSSDSDDLIKKKDLSDVNKEWLKYDIIIYTPSITAGISFEQKHFDCVFGYFTNRSCDVYTLLQMLYRVRNLKEKKIYLYIDIYETYDNIPCTREDILENINYSIKYLINEMINYKIEYNLEMTEVYNKINKDDIYFTLWKENKFIYFNCLLCYYQNLLLILKRNGCIISYLDEKNNKENKIDIKSLISLINYEENEKILKIPNIDDLKYEELSNKILLTEEEKYCKKKYFLKQIYNINYEDMNIELLEKYNKPEIITICLNLNKVKNFTKPFEEIYSYVLNNVIYDNDINNINVLNILNIEEIINFKKIFIIIDMLGLNVMNFDLKLTNEELEVNIINNKNYIYDNIKYLNREFEYNINYIKDTNKLLQFIKKITYDIFGIKFINKENTLNGELNWVHIERMSLFNDTFPLKCNT